MGHTQMKYFSQFTPYYNKPEWYETRIVYEHLRMLFDDANQKLIKQDIDLFTRDSSERTICGALMLHLKSALWGTPFSHYNVDTEYNRNFDDPKAIYVNHERRFISCDLIVHSRGRYKSQDNLITIEMKKEYRDDDEKQRDRERIRALTSPTYDNHWTFNGTELPEYVCRYILGVYYEIKENHTILLEYYWHGDLIDDRKCNW